MHFKVYTPNGMKKLEAEPWNASQKFMELYPEEINNAIIIIIASKDQESEG